MMAITTDSLLQLKEDLAHCGFAIECLPPIAVDEENMADLMDDEDFANQNIVGALRGIY